MQDWRSCLARVAAQAGITWQVSLDAAAAAIGEFLRPQLRHHHAAPHKVAAGRPPLCEWIAETYDALRRIEAGDDGAQYARLDSVRAKFAAWRAGAPRVSLAAAIGREPLTISASPTVTPVRAVSFG
jgi:hypothetical protein